MGENNQKKLLIKNIKSLVQVRDFLFSPLSRKALNEVPEVHNAWLLIENGKFTAYGTMDNLSVTADRVIDATGRLVLPAFIDAHTHLVFAESREREFVDKINGLSYAEIAAKGGGILNSAEKVQNMSLQDLLSVSEKRLYHLRKQGTGSLEIKSGYGLSTTDEIKMLQVIRSLSEKDPCEIKATFLGAHAVPKNISKEAYIKLIKEEMIPEISRQNLADYIDVFCENGFFSVEESRDILMTGMNFGLKPRLHANQLAASGGVQLGVELGALSVDHLEHCGKEEISVLQNSDVIPVLLPGAAFFLRLPFPPVRKMIEEGLPVALASDFNPGSSPGGSMQLMWSLACIGMKMTPQEALNAITINSSFAIEVPQASITINRKADFIITNEIPSLEFMPYSIGDNHVWKLFLSGNEIEISQ